MPDGYARFSTFLTAPDASASSTISLSMDWNPPRCCLSPYIPAMARGTRSELDGSKVIANRYAMAEPQAFLEPSMP